MRMLKIELISPRVPAKVIKVMANRERSPDYIDSVDWLCELKKVKEELVANKDKLAQKERDVTALKKVLEEEKRCKEKMREREYRIEREINELKRKVTRWEYEEERKLRKRRKESEEREMKLKGK